AVVHALGMNMLAMMNITMAAVLSVLVALMAIFVGAIIVTLVAAAVLAIPGVDIIDAAGLAARIGVDSDLFDVIEAVQPYVFNTLTVLNAAEGTVAIVMPFAGYFASTQPGGDYGAMVQKTWSFSSSMVPMRAPYFSNKLDNWIKNKLPT